MRFTNVRIYFYFTLLLSTDCGCSDDIVECRDEHAVTAGSALNDVYSSQQHPCSPRVDTAVELTPRRCVASRRCLCWKMIGDRCESLTCCRIEDVFEWVLEVDEDALGEDRGRIQIIVEYQMNALSSSSSPRQQQQQQHHGASRRARRHRQRSTSSTSKDSMLSASSVYRSVQNRITAHVDIQRDNTYAIVPVVKV